MCGLSAGNGEHGLLHALDLFAGGEEESDHGMFHGAGTTFWLPRRGTSADRVRLIIMTVIALLVRVRASKTGDTRQKFIHHHQLNVYSV